MECLHGTAAWRADGCGADESRMGRTSHSIMPASLERWLVGCARPLPFPLRTQKLQIACWFASFAHFFVRHLYLPFLS